jgi:hypothetical protein
MLSSCSVQPGNEALYFSGLLDAGGSALICRPPRSWPKCGMSRSSRAFCAAGFAVWRA